MNKNTESKQNSYNQAALNIVAKKFGITKRYVRECLRGNRERAAITPTIKREYAKAYKATQEFIKTQAKEI